MIRFPGLPKPLPGHRSLSPYTERSKSHPTTRAGVASDRDLTSRVDLDARCVGTAMHAETFATAGRAGAVPPVGTSPTAVSFTRSNVTRSPQPTVIQ